MKLFPAKSPLREKAKCKTMTSEDISYQRILTVVACEHSLTEGSMTVVVRLLVVFSKFRFIKRMMMMVCVKVQFSIAVSREISSGPVIEC